MEGNLEPQVSVVLCLGKCALKCSTFTTPEYCSAWTDEATGLAARPSSEVKMITTDDDKLACIR